MKKFGIFILGIVVGILLTLIVAFFVGVALQNTDPLGDGLTLFEKPTGCLTKEPIKVFQVIAPDAALANERSNREYDWYNGKVVLVVSSNDQTYYDEQVIKPKTCFQQVGTYKYETKAKNCTRYRN